MKSKIIILFLFTLIESVFSIEPNEEIVDLKDESKELPTPEDKDIYYIPILHTNDIHGSFYPKKTILPNGQEFTIGGLEYLGKYASIMLEQWRNRFLYFDTGDQFQGGIESFISNGEIIMDFLNALQIKNSVVGNHEFDFNIPFLKEYMNKSNFTWVIDNIKNTTSGKYITFPKQKNSIMIEVGENPDYKIKLGIIGLVTQETAASTNGQLEDLYFDNYIKVIREESRNLKAQGANAIIVIAHLGLYCKNDLDKVKLTYGLRDNNTHQEDCRKSDEAYQLLHSLDKDMIDLLLAGHKHDVTHHWVNNTPVMSNDRNGKYAQIVYLPFNRTTKQLIKEKILMEGPLPICGKIFKNRKICDLPVNTEAEYEEYGVLSNFTFHDNLIEKESNITKIAEKYLTKFNEYNKDYLTKTYDYFESTREEENPLGNFFVDFLRHISGADISLINPGTFRVPIYRGEITNASIYSFNPFNDKVVKFKAYGIDIIRIFKILQESEIAFFPFSGLRMRVRKKPTKKLLSIKIWDGHEEKEIEHNKLYTMVSNDYCFPLVRTEMEGDVYEKIYRWFKPIDGEIIKIDESELLREMTINYMRYIDELKANKYYNKKNPRMRIVDI